MADDEQARRERAEQLRREIERLRSGERNEPPRTPREFVEEKAREEKRRAEEADEEPESGGD
jgi:hypothetical protein